LTNTIWNAANGNCITYCHGGLGGMLAGASSNPGWDQNAYLNFEPTKDKDCNKCHYSPPPGKGHSSNELIIYNAATPTIKACGSTNCHDEVMNTDGTFKPAGPLLNQGVALHVNGTTNTTATCTTCHTTLPPNTGSHQKHGDHLETLGLIRGLDVQPTGDGTVWNETNYPLCAACHDMTTETGHFGDNSEIMGVNKTSEAFSTTPSYPMYDPEEGEDPPLSGKNCYNARCHFVPTPHWESPSTLPGWP
jgi:hypothetical protein